MPAELKDRLAARAAQRNRNLNGLIVETLEQRLGKKRMSSSNGSSNGRGRSDDRVRVAIIGVGNCANSLLQGVEYYKRRAGRPARPRLDARRSRRLPRP